MEAIEPFAMVCLKGKTLAKYHAVITFLETKENYKPEMTQDDFVKNCLSFLGCVKIPDYLRDYLVFIYDFHKSDVSADYVYEKTDGRAFTEIVNSMIGKIEPGMTEIEFENHLIDGYPAGGGNMLKKPRWVNWIRKIIDFIDDHWKK